MQSSLDFPIVKLLDFEERWDELETDTNPFSMVVMAQLQTQRTQQPPIEQINEIDILDGLLRQAVTVDSLAAFEQLLDAD